MSRFSTITGYRKLLYLIPSQKYNTKGLYINMYVTHVIGVVKLLLSRFNKLFACPKWSIMYYLCVLVDKK